MYALFTVYSVQVQSLLSVRPSVHLRSLIGLIFDMERARSADIDALQRYSTSNN